MNDIVCCKNKLGVMLCILSLCASLCSCSVTDVTDSVISTAPVATKLEDYPYDVGVASPAEDFTYTASGDLAFITKYVGSDAEVVIPLEIDGLSVAKLSYACFDHNSVVTSVVMPNSVYALDDLVFSECTSLKSVGLSQGLTSMGEGVFSGCTSLESILIPEGITTLPAKAFHACSSLSSITMSNSVSSFGAYCFYECTAMCGMEVSSAVESIGAYCFYGCTSMTDIFIKKGCKEIDVTSFMKCKDLTIHASTSSYAASFARNNNILLDTTD